MFAVHKILHPTDFSPQAERAFHAACDLAHKYNAELVLLHVEPRTVINGEMDTDLFPDPTSRKQIEARLESLLPRDRRVRIQLHVLVGKASQEIIQLATDKACDLIVMGSHGRKGLSRLLLGSVAQDVLRRAPCPVLVINRAAGEHATEEVDGFVEARPRSVALTTLLDELLQVLKIHARETERLVEHVERHTDRLLEPSQMGLVVSELAALQAQLDGVLALKA